MKRLALSAVLALFLVAPGCAGGPGDPDSPGALNVGVPGEAASIIGEVMVEQVPTRSAGYPIAWVSVTSRTRILVRSAGQTSRGSIADLTTGAEVQTWFTGTVRESWPVQADAATILVER